MNKGIAIAGNLIVDTVKMIDTFPEVGMLTNIRDIQPGPGGCAANTIADIALLDKTVPLKCIGLMGNDSHADWLTEKLTGLGVDMSMTKRTDEAATSFTDVMSAMDAGTRTFFHNRGANALFDITDIDFDNLDVDMFHIGYALLLDKFDAPDEEYGTVMARALAYAKKRGIKTSMDVVSENSDRFKRIVTPSLKYVDYAIINEVEASLIAGVTVRDTDKKIITENLKQICRIFFEKGVGELVVIHAPEGGWCMDKAGNFYAIGSVDIPRKDIKGTVGAGDAFCAGMLYSIYKEFDIPYALRVAGCAAICNLTEKNSIDGLRPFEEAMKMEDKYGLQDLSQLTK